MKLIDKLLDDKNEASFAFFWQLIGPLFVLCAFALMPHNTVLFIVGVMGLFLSAKFHMKGFVASIAVLLFGVIASFFISGSDFLWTLGIEGSFALAFFITAQSADRQSIFLKSLFSQVETKSSVISNLEDEVTKSKQETIEKNLVLQEKIASLQKGLDEALAEQSSIVILNEVLRKTTATHISETNAAQEELLNAQIHLDFERKEKGAIQTSLSRLKNESAIIQENKQLTDEINAVRLDKEQTHTINETLARLHAKENLRAKEALDQLEVYEKEKKDVESHELLELKANLENSLSELKQAIFERDALKKEFQDFETLQEECKSLKDRLQLAEVELVQKKVSEAPVDLSQYVEKDTFLHVQETVKNLTHVDALYKQLKMQFDEKNEVLHKTRKELFHMDNALQTLQKEEALDDKIDLKDIARELSSLEEKIAHLEEENKELQDLITSLSEKA